MTRRNRKRFDRGRRRYLAAIVPAALACVLGLSASAAAQTATPKGNLGDPAEQEAKAPWILDCGEGQDQKPQSGCRLLQTVIIRGTGQPLLTAALERRPNAKTYSLVLKIPHGILLPPGLSLEANGIERMVLQYRLSDATGIFAAVVVSDAMLAVFKAGGELKVTVVTAEGQKIGLPVSLDGFSEAFGKLQEKK